MPDGHVPRKIAPPPCSTALAVMAAEERRYDALPPHLWRYPASVADIERKIAALEARRAAIDARLAAGLDLAYWMDCRTRATQGLAILHEARSTLITDVLCANMTQDARDAIAEVT